MAGMAIRAIQEGKKGFFFFEKKKQKTFVHGVRRFAR
jgi:hypothetical protein